MKILSVKNMIKYVVVYENEVYDVAVEFKSHKNANWVEAMVLKNNELVDEYLEDKILEELHKINPCALSKTC
jgi:hypothetical protein